MPKKLTICLNLDGNQLSQFANYDFDCFVGIDDKAFGGKSDGVFEIDSGSKDHQTQIRAFFELSTSDFGIPNKKRIRAYNVGYEANGILDFTVRVDGDEENQKSFPLAPGNLTNRQHGAMFYGHRDLMGRYWMLRIENNNGCDFSLDHIEIFPTILLR